MHSLKVSSKVIKGKELWKHFDTMCFFHSGYWVLQNVYVCLRWRHSASEDEANADSQTLDDVTVPLITEPLTAGPKIVLQWALSVYERTAEF